MRRRLLFFHIPKCGGSTVTRLLERNYTQEESFYTRWWEDGSENAFRSMSMEERYSKHMIAGHETNKLILCVHPETLLVTVLREPVDRVISFYYFIKETSTHKFYAEANNCQVHELRFFGTSNAMTSQLALLDANRYPEEALDRAKLFLLRFSLVGFQDNMTDFFRRLVAACDLPVGYDGSRENVTVSRPPADAISQESLTAIASMNEIDLALYEWACEVFR